MKVYVLFLFASYALIRCSAKDWNRPVVGNKAPDFTAQAVVNEEFKEIKLSSYIGKKYFTFVCPTEIRAFSDRYGEFKDLDTEVLGVSVDSHHTHLAWIKTDKKEGGLGELHYPLVSDLKREISEAWGVLSAEGVALRGLFVIDKEGIVQHATINNLGFGRSVDETKRVLQAIQHICTHPDEVCPAGWKPGAATMHPDPKRALEFFQASV